METIEETKARRKRDLDRFTKKDAEIYDAPQRKSKLEALEIARQKEEELQDDRVKTMIRKLKALKQEQDFMNWLYTE